MGSTVDGLVSGMDTTALIASMMQIEAAPRTMLLNKVSIAQTAISSYQSVNTKLAALKSAGDDLGQLSTWRSVKPTVSSTSVTAIAIGGTDTTTGAVMFDVKALAKAQAGTIRLDTTPSVDGSVPPVTTYPTLNVPDTIEVTNAAGVTVPVDVSQDKTAKGIAAAINSAGAGVKASLVKVSATESVMQFNGTKTGVDNSFTITGLESASTDGKGIVQTVDASDASIVVGDPDNGGYSLSSSTNTFTGLMAGVTMTVTKVEDGITLSSDPDVSGIAAKFKALVDAANASLTEVGNQTAYDSGTKTSSPLTGDFMVRQLSQSILSAVSGGQAGIGSLSKIGIQLDKSGQLTFDADKFTAAYNADPDSIKTAGITLGDTFEALGVKQIANVTAAITGRNNLVDSMNLQVDNWNIRLTNKQDALSKTYANLETALGSLKNQSSWLSGQIASLG